MEFGSECQPWTGYIIQVQTRLIKDPTPTCSYQTDLVPPRVQWVGPIEDMDAEFTEMDRRGGGRVLFSQFVDWALEKNLDIEGDEEYI